MDGYGERLVAYAYTAKDPAVVDDTPVDWPDDLDWDGPPEGWDEYWEYPGPTPPGYIYQIETTLTQTSGFDVVSGYAFALTLDILDRDSYPAYITIGGVSTISAVDGNDDAWTIYFGTPGDTTSTTVQLANGHVGFNETDVYIEPPANYSGTTSPTITITARTTSGNITYLDTLDLTVKIPVPMSFITPDPGVEVPVDPNYLYPSNIGWGDGTYSLGIYDPADPDWNHDFEDGEDSHNVEILPDFLDWENYLREYFENVDEQADWPYGDIPEHTSPNPGFWTGATCDIIYEGSPQVLDFDKWEKLSEGTEFEHMWLSFSLGSRTAWFRFYPGTGLYGPQPQVVSTFTVFGDSAPAQIDYGPTFGHYVPERNSRLVGPVNWPQVEWPNYPDSSGFSFEGTMVPESLTADEKRNWLFDAWRYVVNWVKSLND